MKTATGGLRESTQADCVSVNSIEYGWGRDSRRLASWAGLAMLVGLAWSGCAETVVLPTSETAKFAVERPKRILVYDFAVTRDQVKENEGFLQGTLNDFEETTTYQHEGDIADEVRLVAAEEMVKGIQNLGLPAERAVPNSPVPPHALAITGQFLNVDEGNKAARLVIGFGKGRSEVDIRIQVYGYALDASGAPEPKPINVLKFLTHADSGSTPGAIVMGPAGAVASGVGTAAAVNIGVGVLKGRRSAMGAMTARSVEQAVAYLSEYFGRQGWIPPSKVTHADRP